MVLPSEQELNFSYQIITPFDRYPMFEQKRVLIVDDEESARLYLAGFVKELFPEINLHLAATPNDALFILQNERIECVLLDVEMPGMSGLELLEKLRFYNKSLPIIFVSGFKKAEFIQKALRLDAIDYIDKPVNPIELKAAMIKAFTRLAQPTQSELINNHKSRFCLMTSVGEMFVSMEDLIYFESFKRYSIAYFADGSTKIVRNNLESLTQKLSTTQFLRVSRQYIVNVSVITFVSKSNKTVTIKVQEKLVVLTRIYPQILSQLIKTHRI